MDTDALRAAVDSATEAFGRLDVLVKNAGGVNGKRFLDQSERSWRRHIGINLVSMLAATSAAAPVMVAGGRGGAILNGTAAEFADTAVFLCTPLSAYTTGACLSVDGGCHAASGWTRTDDSWTLYGDTPMQTVGRGDP